MASLEVLQAKCAETSREARHEAWHARRESMLMEKDNGAATGGAMINVEAESLDRGGGLTEEAAQSDGAAAAVGDGVIVQGAAQRRDQILLPGARHAPRH